MLDAAAYGRVFDAADIRASSKYLVFLATGNSLDHHRLGVIVAKKNVKLAAQRNRFKRIVREMFRTRPADPKGLDVVVMARRGVETLDNNTLSTIVREQWQKLIDNRDRTENTTAG